MLCGLRGKAVTRSTSIPHKARPGPPIPPPWPRASPPVCDSSRTLSHCAGTGSRARSPSCADRQSPNDLTCGLAYTITTSTQLKSSIVTLVILMPSNSLAWTTLAFARRRQSVLLHKPVPSVFLLDSSGGNALSATSCQTSGRTLLIFIDKTLQTRQKARCSCLVNTLHSGIKFMILFLSLTKINKNSFIFKLVI